jgi:DsbC/DsbD-like thiol-disulfide interchange protein
MKKALLLGLVVCGGFVTEGASAEAPSATRVRIISTDSSPEASVSVSLEPLVAAIKPGSRFLIAAHFRIAPGYRIGWKAKGDVGRATSVTFRAPAGFDVGPIQYPAPQRFSGTEGGAARGEWLGYENETAVFAEVKAPSTVRADDVIRLDLFAEWAACKDECQVAKTAAFIELEAARSVAARSREVEASLARFRARLPGPAPRSEATWEVTPKEARLVVRVKGATLTDFFSDGSARPAPLNVTASEGGALAIRYDDAPSLGDRPFRGVIAALVNAREAFYEFEVKPKGLGTAEAH